MIREPCQCPELRQSAAARECPACIAWRKQKKHQQSSIALTEDTPPQGRHPSYGTLYAQREAIAQAIHAGVPYEAIARQHKVGAWMLRQFLQDTGLHRPRKAEKDAQVTQVIPAVIAKRQEGLTFKAIGQALGISQHTARRIVYGERPGTHPVSRKGKARSHG